MKIINPILSGSVLASGSFVLPSGRANQRPSNPASGSLFFEISDSGSVLTIYNGSGSSGWETVGKQTTPVTPPPNTDIEYLLVAGGAAGGGSQSWGAGGGGAGGYLSSSLASVASGSSFTVTIGGGGGSVTNAVGTSGTDSSIAGATISTITATGGGGGGGANNSKTDGVSGGSGGGAQGAEIYATPGSGTVGQGNDGGPGADGQVSYTAGGGGGGATTAGQDASVYSDKSGGNGGTGATSNITGTSVQRAGGGGGGTNNGSGGSGTGGTATGGGGAGGTGSGGTNGADGTAATANTGGGGGGAGHGAGGAGGSGVAIFAYDSGSLNCAGGIVGDAGNGRKYHQFNASGTFKVGATSDLQIVTTDLVAHLDAGNFASRGASTWTDLTGNGHNATVNGATLTDNHYYSLDGSNDYFSIADSSNFDSQTITIETWTWFDTNKNYNQLYTKGSDGGEQFEAGGDNTGGVFTAVVWGSGRAGHSTSMSSIFSVNTWTHIVQVIDNTRGWLFYKNGSLIGTDTSKTGTTITYNSSALQLGGDTSISGRYLDGRFAQFRFYTRGFTDAEVLQNYEATKTNFV